METTIGNSNKDLLAFIQPEGTVLEGIRNMVANRLATNGATWADIFERYNSGTWVSSNFLRLMIPIDWVTKSESHFVVRFEL